MNILSHRINGLLVLLLAAYLIGLISPAQAQTRRRKEADNYHFFYLSGGLGYTAMDEQIDKVSTQGNLGGLVGAGYEFRRSQFWMSLGAQMAWHTSSAAMKQIDFGPVAGEDTYGQQANLYYHFSQRDELHFSQVEVPLLMGYYYNGFYAGAGVEVGFFSVGSSVHTSGSFSMEGTYDKYQSIPVSYEELGYKSYTYSDHYSVDLNINAAVIGELGYDVLSTIRSRSLYCQILKVGFYFEYGLNSIIPKGQNAPHISFPYLDAQGNQDATRPQVRPYYYSAETTNKRIAPFMIGVKLTYMIGGSRTGITGTWHRGCQCYE